MSENSDQNTRQSNQEFLVKLWSDRLGRPNIGDQEDFFAAGGSSMQIIEMLMAVSDKYGREIDYAAFLQEPNIRKLSELLET